MLPASTLPGGVVSKYVTTERRRRTDSESAPQRMISAHAVRSVELLLPEAQGVGQVPEAASVALLPEARGVGQVPEAAGEARVLESRRGALPPAMQRPPVPLGVVLPSGPDPLPPPGSPEPTAARAHSAAA